MKMGVDDLFEEFMQLNDFSIRADFRNHARVYTGNGYAGLTREAFMRTIDFAGFVDGREGHRHKTIEGATPEFIAMLIRAGELDEHQRKQILEAYGNRPAARYDEQYELGRRQRMLMRGRAEDWSINRNS